MEAECQLHYTFCNVDITFGPAYSVIEAVRALATQLRARDPRTRVVAVA